MQENGCTLKQSRVSPAVKATGIPTGKNLKAGSFGISQAGKDQAAINRGIAAAKKQQVFLVKQL